MSPRRRSWPSAPPADGRAGDGPTGPDREDVAAHPPADPEAVGRRILLDLLTGAPRTRAELAQRLAAKHVPEEVAERLLDRFTEVGLIDDAAYAETFVRSRHAGRGLARRALSHELARKGVAPEVAQHAVETLDPETELETARALVQRRMRAVAGLPVDTQVRRLAGALARKGYSSSVAYRVVREALGEAVES